jgi:hypothetical protein
MNDMNKARFQRALDLVEWFDRRIVQRLQQRLAASLRPFSLWFPIRPYSNDSRFGGTMAVLRKFRWSVGTRHSMTQLMSIENARMV